MENICYGLKKKPTSSELIQSIEMANCSFIYDLPHSLKHEITEQGTGLSMGQKQRLSLLRALLRKPKVIILDEPTSNVDYDTEKQIIESLLQLKGHATLIVVSHRGDFANISDQHLDLDTLNIKSRMNMIA